MIEKLRELPPGAVAGFAGADAANLYYQTIHEQPITTGYVARWPATLDQVRKNLQDLRAEGRYAELMDAAQATYLVRSRIDMPPVVEPRLKLLDLYLKFEIYTWASSTLPGLDPMTPEPVNDSVQILGRGSEDISVRVFSRGSGGCVFWCAVSLGLGEVYPVAFEHKLELLDDAVFRASTAPDNEHFRGNWGVLDADGRASFRIDASKLPPGENLGLWASLVVFEGRLEGQIRKIHRPVKLMVRR